ncbi:MAG: hypothetical protein ABI650_08395, partial [Dokdonella sp.]
MASAPMAAETLRESARTLDPAFGSALSRARPNGAPGQYRIVVFSHGLRHVSSEVYLPWLESDENKTTVKGSIVVAPLSCG